MKNKGFHNCSQLSVKWECQAVKLRVHLAATINMELSSRWDYGQWSLQGRLFCPCVKSSFCVNLMKRLQYVLSMVPRAWRCLFLFPLSKCSQICAEFYGRKCKESVCFLLCLKVPKIDLKSWREMQLVQGYSIDWIHNQYIWKLCCVWGKPLTCTISRRRELSFSIAF